MVVLHFVLEGNRGVITRAKIGLGEDKSRPSDIYYQSNMLVSNTSLAKATCLGCYNKFVESVSFIP